jgi:hypothetical protein
MSFMAGIISPHRPLEKQKKIQFHHAFAAMEGELSCHADIIESSRSVLVQASFPHMWQGGKSKSGKEYDAVASGVQWREIPHFKSTLDYLITNTKDFTKLKPYLIDSISELTWEGQFIRKIKSCFPPIHNVLSGARAMVSGTSDMKWGQELVENPPQLLMDILRPELRNAINMARTRELGPLRFFLDRVLLLECYFS